MGLLGIDESAAKPCGASGCRSSDTFHGVQEAGSSNLLTQTLEAIAKSLLFLCFTGNSLPNIRIVRLGWR